MHKGKKTAVAITAAFGCGLIIWHVLHWNSSGMYVEMFTWIKTGKAYLVVLYNLGLMGSLGFLLSLLLGEITNLLNYRYSEVANLKNKGEAGAER